MGSTVEDPDPKSDTSEATGPPVAKPTAGWRGRYQGSFAQDFVKALSAVDFGNQIIIFGASLLLSVLPLIIVLSTLASHRIQDDIARHLGLSAQGTRIVDGLFKASASSFNLAVLIGLLLSFAGTIVVGRSVEMIYEKAFDQPPLSRGQGWLRCTVWVVVISGVLIADGAIDHALRRDTGSVVFGLVEFFLFTLFFWWSIHFLLAGRESWRAVRHWLVATRTSSGSAWAYFAAFYFSTTIVDDSKTYGTIGVTFTLVTWFIASGRSSAWEPLPVPSGTSGEVGRRVRPGPASTIRPVIESSTGARDRRPLPPTFGRIFALYAIIFCQKWRHFARHPAVSPQLNVSDTLLRRSCGPCKRA